MAGTEPFLLDSQVCVGYPEPVDARVWRCMGILGDLSNAKLEIRIPVLSRQRLEGAVVSAV